MLKFLGTFIFAVISIILIIIIILFIYIKKYLRESVIVNKIIQVASKEDFSREDLVKIREVIDSIERLPSCIVYDVSGDDTMIRTIQQEIEGLAPEEASKRIITLIEDYNNKVDER